MPNGRLSGPTVFFDGSCPLCRREIAFYRELGGAEDLSWVDVSASDATLFAAGLTRAQAMARFHVLTAEGKLVSGGAAFASLWSHLDGFRLAGRIGQTWPINRSLDLAYAIFLKMRPFLQRFAGRRQEL